jgi:hypothetical protein
MSAATGHPKLIAIIFTNAVCYSLTSVLKRRF